MKSKWAEILAKTNSGGGGKQRADPDSDDDDDDDDEQEEEDDMQITWEPGLPVSEEPLEAPEQVNAASSRMLCIKCVVLCCCCVMFVL